MIQDKVMLRKVSVSKDTDSFRWQGKTFFLIYLPIGTHYPSILHSGSSNQLFKTKRTTKIKLLKTKLSVKYMGNLNNVKKKKCIYMLQLEKDVI